MLKVKPSACAATNRITDVVIDHFGFSCKHLFNITVTEAAKLTIRKGFVPLVLDTVLHEICHVIIEDRDTKIKINQSNRRFEGHNNELQTVALQTLILSGLPGHHWSLRNRCLEVGGVRANFEQTYTVVKVLMLDPKLCKYSKDVIHLCNTQAYYSTGEYLDTAIKYVKEAIYE